jgi:oxygen-dependent protoporphyrinogen oxidase
MKTVVVVGGGISGLASAFLTRRELEERGVEARVLVLEQTERPGGHIRTDGVDGFLSERGPNGFLDNEPRMFELIGRLGLASRVVQRSALARRRFIYRRGRLHPLPETPPAFFASKLLSPAAKARALMEVLVPPRRDGAEESVGMFGRRRLGRAFTSTFLDPLVSGIFAGDVDRLSLPAAFPRMGELESRYGSLFKALIRIAQERKREARARRRGAPARPDPATPRGAASREARRTAPGGVLHSLDGGMEVLVRALAGALGDGVRVRAEIESISPRDEGGFRVRVRDLGSPARAPEEIAADAVVLAAAGPEQARLLGPWDDGGARALAGISAAPISVVALGYDRTAIAHPLDGFGFLIPRDEGVRTLGVIFSSTLFPGRAPEGKVLLHALIGGACDEAVADMPPEEALDRAREDLRAILGERAAPVFARVYPHRVGIPQYNLGHPARVRAADAAEARRPALTLTGSWLRGISMNLCVKDAFRVARRVSEAVSAAASPVPVR